MSTDRWISPYPISSSSASPTALSAEPCPARAEPGWRRPDHLFQRPYSDASLLQRTANRPSGGRANDTVQPRSE